MYDNYKQILEAVNRGIQLALDDFDDNEQVQNIKSKQVYNKDYTKEYLDLMKEVVDLGLPSGTLWCKYNLGASCEPNNNRSWFGDYYAWGELEPNKKKYDWDHYKFYDGPDTKATKLDISHIRPEYYITKYTNLADIEKKSQKLLPEDDAAYQNKNLYNFKFYIPTEEQAKELLDNVKIIYVKDVSKNSEYENAQGYTGAGWFMISKINGNYIFFPETGMKEGTSMSLNKIDSGIWTSCMTNTTCAQAIKLYPSFNQERSFPIIYGFWKYEGLPIRPVINL